MKWITPVICIVLAVCFLSSTGCQKNAADEIGPGTYDGSVYRCDYFGMSIDLPSTWSYQDKEAMEMLKNAGKKMMEGSNKDLKTAIEFSEHQTVYLFAIFKHPLGTPVDYNPSLMLIAERIGHIPGIKRGKDYQYHSKKVMESAQMNMKFPKEIYTVTLGGNEFDVLYSEINFMNMEIKQNQYTIIKKGYALTFNASFTTEEQEAELKGILDTVTIK